MDLSDFRSFYNIKTEKEFENFCFKLVKVHYELNPIYRSFCDLINTPPDSINSYSQIPFLPISFFKTHDVKIFCEKEEAIFQSSMTSSIQPSRHFIKNLSDYENSFRKGFEHFYGEISDYTILALLPGYIERKNSSLIYMVSNLIQKTKSKHSGFYINDLKNLKNTLEEIDSKGYKTLLIGVSFALLEFINKYNFNLKNTIIIETGGMKGKLKELVRDELHEKLSKGFGVNNIHSEYGMTELFSQAYSKEQGLFICPPWMKVFTRDIDDPLFFDKSKPGGLNIIDLANFNTCPFIATQDLGKMHLDGSFEVLGRFDQSEIRGCNLMVI